eukprot:CAMPEP_0119290136 /NCGR_PEP_ID=MMETSP1329-20130426/40226_1 /TAXON_ID=114041 /ORGANISM="Genus nov. species nov., Strain RCC1024" /LENGTH=166 /DNA_ID=CAMNT_0007290951 /DNA_START=97 /DNA_END=593 /DNA_ORIENTATION=+
MQLRLSLVLSVVSCFVVVRRQRSARRRAAVRTRVISPEAMVTLQKMTNRKSFEETVETYAKQKRLSTREAELEYATYLLDPDAFVLDAANANKFGGGARSSGGQKAPTNVPRAQPGQRRSPLLQAYIDEGGPEVKERIEKFERENTLKALCVVGALVAFVLTHPAT